MQGWLTGWPGFFFLSADCLTVWLPVWLAGYRMSSLSIRVAVYACQSIFVWQASRLTEGLRDLVPVKLTDTSWPNHCRLLIHLLLVWHTALLSSGDLYNAPLPPALGALRYYGMRTIHFSYYDERARKKLIRVSASSAVNYVTSEKMSYAIQNTNLTTEARVFSPFIKSTNYKKKISRMYFHISAIFAGSLHSSRGRLIYDWYRVRKNREEKRWKEGDKGVTPKR